MILAKMQGVLTHRVCVHKEKVQFVLLRMLGTKEKQCLLLYSNLRGVNKSRMKV